MCGALAGEAEVVRGGDEAFTEELEPHAIHEDAGGERVLRAGEPLGEFEAAALLQVSDGAAAAGAEEAAWDGCAEFFGFAVDVEFAVFDFFGVAQAHGERGIDLVGEGGLGGRTMRRASFDDRLQLGTRRDFGSSLKLVQWCLRCGEALMRGSAPHGLGAAEDAGECVVITRRDGIGFVIVATGAADAEAEDAAADDVDLIGDDIHLEVLVHGLRRLCAEREQAGGDELAISLCG